MLGGFRPEVNAITGLERGSELVPHPLPWLGVRGSMSVNGLLATATCDLPLSSGLDSFRVAGSRCKLR
jgi:hypothetical protein